MRGRVDDPRRMKSHDGAQEYAPQHQAKSSDREQRDCEDGHRRKMVFREPDMKAVLGQIWDVAFECRHVLAQRIASQYPTRMRPPLAIARRVRITFLIRELVMLTMDSHPEKRAAFHGRHAANRKKVLKPLGCREGAVGEQSMITNAKSQAAGDPV